VPLKFLDSNVTLIVIVFIIYIYIIRTPRDNRYDSIDLATQRRQLHTRIQSEPKTAHAGMLCVDEVPIAQLTGQMRAYHRSARSPGILIDRTADRVAPPGFEPAPPDPDATAIYATSWSAYLESISRHTVYVGPLRYGSAESTSDSISGLSFHQPDKRGASCHSDLGERTVPI